MSDPARNNHTFWVYIKLLLAAMLWGGSFVAGRMVVKTVEPFSAAFLRFAFAGLLLLVVAWKIEGRCPRVRRGHILPLLFMGITGVFAYNACFFSGLRFVEAGRSALIIATSPIFILLGSVCFLREKLTSAKIAGILISTTGAIIVIARGSPLDLLNGSVGWGEVTILGCVVTWTIYSLMGKAVMTELSPLVMVAYSTIIGTIGFAVPAWFEGLIDKFPAYSVANWFCIFYLGFFGTVLAFVWYCQGINKIGPTKAALVITVVPIFALLFGFLLLEEPLTLSIATGTFLVAYGIYLTTKLPTPT